MSRGVMECGFMLGVVTLAACGGSSGDLPTTNTDCEAAAEIEFICGVASPEDIVAIPNTDFAIVSGYIGGAIHYVSTHDQTRDQVFPVASPRLRHNTETYPSCPGPIDPNEGENFSAHGLNLHKVDEGVYLLYVVHHGFRESIEIFEIDTRYQGAVSTSPVPGFAWIGCVIAPESLTLNSGAPTRFNSSVR